MTVFADAFFYLALFSKRDAYHHRATKFLEEFTGTVVTTQWVLTEVADGLAGIPERRSVQGKFRLIAEDDGTYIVPASADLFERGLWLYNMRPDKEWSLTDCISFVVMQDEGLTDALTGDHHFAQAGFRALLAS